MKRSTMIKVTILVITLIVLGVSLITLCGKRDEKISASDIGCYEYYTEYHIQEGDSLYSIAYDVMKQYPDTSRIYDVKGYAEEVARINQLSSTKIYYDSYLVIPYISPEYK